MQDFAYGMNFANQMKEMDGELIGPTSPAEGIGHGPRNTSCQAFHYLNQGDDLRSLNVPSTNVSLQSRTLCYQDSSLLLFDGSVNGALNRDLGFPTSSNQDENAISNCQSLDQFLSRDLVFGTGNTFGLDDSMVPDNNAALEYQFAAGHAGGLYLFENSMTLPNDIGFGFQDQRQDFFDYIPIQQTLNSGFLNAAAAGLSHPANTQMHINAPIAPAVTRKPCTHPGCPHTFDRDWERTRHESSKHGINLILYHCPIPECSKHVANAGVKGYKRADKLTEHLWRKHADRGHVKRPAKRAV